VDQLDLAVARAMQFGRALRPDELRAVHFVIDENRAEKLAEEWRDHGLANLSLELIDCPDRRLTRVAVEVVAHELSSGDSEVCVLLPERMYNGVWHRILHDQTAESLSREISRLPHANVTTVPFHFDEEPIDVPLREAAKSGNGRANGRAKHAQQVVTTPLRNPDGTTPIGSIKCRQHVRVHGRVQAIRVEPLAGSPSVECTLVDVSGGVAVVFFGRRQIEGITLGSIMTVEGMTIEHHGRLAIMNPVYELT